MNQNKKKSLLEDKMLQNETVYRAACDVFGVNDRIGEDNSPRVFRYYDQRDEISADLLTVPDIPAKGAVSYATVGLIHHSIGLRREDSPLRVEIVSACYARYEYYPNLLSSCAFDVINAHFACSDSTLAAGKRECVNMYVQDSALPHLVFLPAAGIALWQSPPPALSFHDKRVFWLYALPVSNDEYAHYEAFGPDFLLESLRQAEANLLDLERKSVF